MGSQQPEAGEGHGASFGPRAGGKGWDRDEIWGTAVHGLAVVAKTLSSALGRQESVSVH